MLKSKLGRKGSAYLLEGHFIHDVLGGQNVLVSCPNKLHGQGNWPVGGIKVEETRLCDAQKGGHVLVVWQRGRQAYNADHALTGFYLCTTVASGVMKL